MIKMMLKNPLAPVVGIVLSLLAVQQAQAAVALDRTRVVFNGTEKSVSLNISNENKLLPYLAQGWIENAQGEKITSPFAVLPPVQRLEPNAKGQMKVQATPAVSSLPQDRESLFYFNMREIPPKSDQPNTLQLAMQIRIKLFYRPAGLARGQDSKPWQEQITLTRQGDKFLVNNPTGYFVTLVNGSNRPGGASISSFESLMVAPKSSDTLRGSLSEWGNSPVLTYINDFGGRMQLQFTCSGSTCTAAPVKT